MFKQFLPREETKLVVPQDGDHHEQTLDPDTELFQWKHACFSIHIIVEVSRNWLCEELYAQHGIGKQGICTTGLV